ncbi:tRNA pseudouridine(13) synthase TruD [Corallococcus carmarthensis]|uniref:tRNA pseudouridine(13) synthase TruD n=1 Tax=Corallococcus carmarthensis TaxID=2316728 RepID=A0A3A8JQ21_9BACT|nr:tRNA pseudouridine(13) synthase TruD [Corallococcus carmarthensis]NOK19973.1 tRNA pseudouridine(13) synthase TruD [Corallococcus carmarthensis]RKG97315.1 tRNA pseudouridine(13) synthase TruD [Corallococcus carmarthensis]
MRIKQKPEDFSVKESYRFDEVDSGRHRVYLMDKQKLSTFDAVNRIRDAFGLKPGAISYCGLKDKQGRTEQIIAVDGADVDMQEPDLRLKFLGRTDKPLSARNITSNRFSVTVRALTHDSLAPLNLAAAEVNRLGVVNYFDSQRFGALKHGQGFIAKDLIRGDFEAALHNYFARPSELDRTEDAKVKGFWRDNWGRWDARVPFEGAKKYHRILRSLRDHPGDWLRAFLQIDSDYRAMILFEYQSFLWNEGVRRYLQLMLPREAMFPMRYQAGTLLHFRDATPDVLHTLREKTFPLVGPDSTFEDPKVAEAMTWVLGKEKLKLPDLRIKGAERMLYFKEEQRPLVMFPHKLVVGRTQNDDVNRGEIKVNVAFTLPPGAYATLVIKRLFHFEYTEDTKEDIRTSQRPRLVTTEHEEARVDAARSAARASEGPARHRTLADRAPSRVARPASSERPARPGTARRDDRAEAPGRDARPARRDSRAEAPGKEARAPGRIGRPARAPREALPELDEVRAAPPPAPEAEIPLGFRAKQKQRKQVKADGRAEKAEKQRLAAAKSAKKQKRK